MKGVRALLTATLLLLSLPARPALARSTAVLSYPLGDVWSTAVRFVRVDRGYTVREKDEESGYILFEMLGGGKPDKASLGLTGATAEQARASPRAAFSTPAPPRHFETMLLDKL